MNTKKILVVEDDKVTQEAISGVLRQAGYQVFTAEDAVTAVHLARTHTPDLITLDITLAMTSPEDAWDGFSVAGWIRRINQSEQGKSQPVIIVISGLRPERIIDRVAAVGAYTFIPKPVDKQQLLTAVAEALKL
jgi:CheY-like chemotaxis protein